MIASRLVEVKPFFNVLQCEACRPLRIKTHYTYLLPRAFFLSKVIYWAVYYNVWPFHELKLNNPNKRFRQEETIVLL
uniref:Uncharacterized protein n=1 Tax=Rhizophora mucronata TaxID=61149 RepID=A0A2P2QMX1_RHIMU